MRVSDSWFTTISSLSIEKHFRISSKTLVGSSAACASPGTWRCRRPACPAVDWVCLTGRWCRPSRHTAACTPAGPHRTPSCTPAAQRPSWSLGTRCRERGTRRCRSHDQLWCTMTVSAQADHTAGRPPFGLTSPQTNFTSLLLPTLPICTFGPVLSLRRSATRRTRRASKD